MESAGFPLILLVLVLLGALSPLPRHIQGGKDDVEDHLLQGLNSYRTTNKLPALSKHKNADCVADKVADKFENRPCSTSVNAIPAGSVSQIPDYPKILDKCGVNASTVRDGVILPVCVPKLVPTLVLTNYTHSGYAKYVNDSRYTGAGMGSEDDWMVVVLATSAPGGSFSGATVVTVNGVVGWLLLVLLGLVMVV